MHSQPLSASHRRPFIYDYLRRYPQSTPSRKTGAQSKQAATWLTPEQIETIRDACLSDTFPTYLQDRNETIITVLADTGLRVSELVALDWDYLDLDAESPELILPGSIQKLYP